MLNYSVAELRVNILVHEGYSDSLGTQSESSGTQSKSSGTSHESSERKDIGSEKKIQ